MQSRPDSFPLLSIFVEEKLSSEYLAFPNILYFTGKLND